MNVRAKLIAGFSVLLVLMWIIVLHIIISSTYNLGNVKQDFAAIEKDIIPDATERNEIMTVANVTYRVTMDYVYYDRDGAELGYIEHVDRLGEISKEYLSEAGTDDQTTYSTDQELLAAIDVLILNLGNMVSLKEQGGSQSELMALEKNTCLPALVDLEQLIVSREAEDTSRLAMIGVDFEEAYNWGGMLLLISAGILTLIGLAAAFFTTKSIIRPLQALHKGTEMVAQGNLDYKVGTNAKDEIGQLSRDFDKMTLSLKESMTSLEVLNNEIAERKKTEEALISREQRFLDIAENALEWIWETDTEGRFTYSSPAVEKILGYTPEEILGMYFYDFFHPEDRQGLKKAAFEVFAQKQPLRNFINRNMHKDGKLVYLSTSGVPVVDAKGKVLGYRGVDTDITEQKRKEKLQQDENYVLTLLGQGAELGQLLEAIIRLGEEHDPSIKALVTLYDPVKRRLYTACAPNLPEEHLQLMENGIPIRPDIGPSSRAAYCKEQVIVPDITDSPLFHPLGNLVRVSVKHNLLACWSQPILAANGDLLGTITNYSNRVGEPDADSIRVLEWSARIAGIAIERKKAEKALRESEEKFFKAFRSSPTAIVISTLREGRFIEINDSYTDIAGYTREEIIGRTSREVNIWADIKDRHRILRILKSQGRVYDEETGLRRKSGEIRTLLYSAELIDIGNQPCIISTNLDITERKKMENELREHRDHLEEMVRERTAELTEVNKKLHHELRERKKAEEALLAAKNDAEKANRAKSEFLARTSHEIRTPIHGVMGMIDLVLGNGLEPTQRQYLQTAKTSAVELLDIINDILDLSKIEARQLEPECEKFDLCTAMKEALDSVAVIASQKGLELTCNLKKGVKTELIGDSRYLRQVLVNLIGNAIKFTQKGEVAVSVEPLSDGKKYTELQFTIRDTGIGIPKDKLEMIFEPFQQADGSINRVYGGTGLGLTISRHLVNQIGGRIWVESDNKKGSTFHFTGRFTKQANGKCAGRSTKIIPGIKNNPCVETDLKESVEEVVLDKHDGPGLRVLVAEDNPMAQIIARKTLEKMGHTVEIANNGSEAVKMYKEGEYGLIVMDAEMPVLNGLEATRRIRKHESNSGKRIPIIAMTAYAMQEDRKRCLEAGMDGYLSKPAQAEDINTAITELCCVTGRVADFKMPAAKSPSQDSPAVDVNTAYRVFGDDDALLGEAVNLFLEEDYPVQLKQVRKGIELDDAAVVRAAAHSIKGAVRSLGGLALGDIAQRLEDLGRDGDLADAGTLADKIETEIKRFADYYADYWCSG